MLKFQLFLKKKLWILLFSSTLSIPLLAQNIVDHDLFTNSATIQSILFKGELFDGYGSRSPNDGSTYFAYTLNFEKGEVLFRGKLYRDVLINLNAFEDEIYISDLFGNYLLVNKDYVDSFSMGNLPFVHYKQEPNSILNSGYYQVLYMGNVKLFKKIQKKYYEENVTWSQTRSKGYKLSESFYLWKGDNWYRINRKADLKRCFPDQTKAIDQLSRTRKLNFRKNTERTLIETLTYIDNL